MCPALAYLTRRVCGLSRHDDHGDEPVLAEVGHEQRVHLRQDPAGSDSPRAAARTSARTCAIRMAESNPCPLTSPMTRPSAPTRQGQEIEVVAARCACAGIDTPHASRPGTLGGTAGTGAAGPAGRDADRSRGMGLSAARSRPSQWRPGGNRPVWRFQGRDGLTRQVELTALSAVGNCLAEHFAPEQLLPETLVEAPWMSAPT